MRRITLTLLTFLAVALLPASAPAAGCPNEALRTAQGAATLPACMALEMVSPPRKFSQPAYLPSFSRDGERVLAIVQTALGETPGYQYYGGDRYVFTRNSAAGWDVSSTSPQDPAVIAGGRRWGSAVLFSPDLSRWAQISATQPQYNVGISQLFEGSLSGSFEPLSPPLVPVDDGGSERIAVSVLDLQLTGASADLSAGVLRVALGSTGYFPEDPRSDSFLPEPGEDRNSYVAFTDESGEPQLELLARDKDGIAWGGRCGAHIGGEEATFNQGAISPDGERILFTTRPAQPWDEEEAKGPICDTGNGLRVMQRTATPTGPVIKELIPGGPGASGDDLFQAASADGTKVYLTSPRKLTASDADAEEDPCSPSIGASKGCDLYLYDADKPEGQRVIQASDGEGSQEADVLGDIAAVSGDGSRAYFAAQGVLTADPNPEGDLAQGGQPNLYLYEAGTDELSFIATLSPSDQGSLWGAKGSFLGDAYAAPLHGATLEDGGNGHLLAFASKAQVTADDEDGSHRDVFRYDASSDTLQRISKPAEGGADNGPFEATVNPAFLKIIEYNFGEAGRWMSEDGETIAFATAEPLLPSDEDEETNPYLWHEGQLGATPAPITEPPAVSPVGGQVAFSSQATLLPQDGDVAADIYVARQGGGFPLPMPPTVCDPLQEGSCQSAALPPAAPPAPASLAFSGPGNQGKPARCRKGRVKRRGRCVRKARKGKARKQAGARKRGRR
jgi:hypothetical protein